VIVNPAAGNGKELVRRVTTSLTQLGVGFELRVSSSPENVAELVAEGKAAGIRQFAGVGGDGTAHLIVNGLMQHEWDSPPGLAVLPAGSGSDFIRTFALPRDLETASHHLATDEWYRSDVMRIEGGFGVKYALNVVEAGVGGASVGTAARMPRWVGAKRYPLAFWAVLPRFQPGQVEVKAGRHEVAAPAIAVIVANGQFFGGGMNIAPRASVADGILDVQVFSGPRRKALSVMPRVVRGMHLQHKNVRRITGGEVHVRVPDDWPIEADGESLGSGSISVTVQRGAIEFKI
jgi:YegS/Rv2252/BmrU family lipid kinase